MPQQIFQDSVAERRTPLSARLMFSNARAMFRFNGSVVVHYGNKSIQMRNRGIFHAPIGTNSSIWIKMKRSDMSRDFFRDMSDRFGARSFNLAISNAIIPIGWHAVSSGLIAGLGPPAEGTAR